MYFLTYHVDAPPVGAATVWRIVGGEHGGGVPLRLRLCKIFMEAFERTRRRRLTHRRVRVGHIEPAAASERLVGLALGHHDGFLRHTLGSYSRGCTPSLISRFVVYENSYQIISKNHIGELDGRSAAPAFAIPRAPVLCGPNRRIASPSRVLHYASTPDLTHSPPLCASASLPPSLISCTPPPSHTIHSPLQFHSPHIMFAARRAITQSRTAARTFSADAGPVVTEGLEGAVNKALPKAHQKVLAILGACAGLTVFYKILPSSPAPVEVATAVVAAPAGAGGAVPSLFDDEFDAFIAVREFARWSVGMRKQLSFGEGQVFKGA